MILNLIGQLDHALVEDFAVEGVEEDFEMFPHRMALEGVVGPLEEDTCQIGADHHPLEEIMFTEMIQIYLLGKVTGFAATLGVGI